MGRNFGEASYSMEGSSHQHTQRDWNTPQKSIGESSFLGGQNAVHEVKNSSISRTTSSKRSFRQGFLNWAAFERSLSPNISELVKRTCPVADCEKPLESEVEMRIHLKECIHLEKGFYRCHETDKIKRIGKCESDGCRELQQYKGLFSNAMHTLGRRLSPRGRRPSHLIKKISNKHSKSSHMFGVDPRISCSGFDWDGMDNSDVVPAYTPCSPVELSSNREIGELPAHHGFAELCAEQGTSTYDSFETPESDLAELGVDDDFAQVSEFLAQGTHQPTELSTAFNSVFQPHDDNTVKHVQVDGWDITPSNYATTPEDLLNMCCNKSLSMTDALMDAPSQPRILSTMQAFDYHELVSPVENRDWNGRYPSTCIVSPMQSFTDSDIDQRYSIFSTPSHSTSGTSVSSKDSIQPASNSTPAPFFSFLDEPDRIFEEPIEEFELPESTDILSNRLGASLHSFEDLDRVYQEPIADFHLSEVMSMSTSQSNTSIFDSSGGSGCNSTPNQGASPLPGYFSNMLHEEFSQSKCRPHVTNMAEVPFQQPIRPLHRIRRKPIASSSPRKDPLIGLSPDIDYSLKTVMNSQSPGKPTPYQCEYCPQQFTDRSNLKRHVKFTCKKRPGYTPDKNKKPFKCNFDCCKSRFTQLYNLRVHQKTQGHLPPALPQHHPYQSAHHSFGFQQLHE